MPRSLLRGCLLRFLPDFAGASIQIVVSLLILIVASSSRLGWRRRPTPSRPGIELFRLHHIRDMDRAFAFDDLALRILLALAHVFLDHMHAFHNHPLLFPDHGDDPTTFAFVCTGDHYCFVALLYMKIAHN